MRRLLAAATVLLVLSGCGARPGTGASTGASLPPSGTDACSRPLSSLPPQQAAYPVTVPGLGATTTIDSGTRVVTTALGAGEIVYALGAGDRLVARDLASAFPGSEALPLANPGHQIALEATLALRPDLVIASNAPEDAQVLSSLAKAGIAVAVIPDATGVGSISARITATAAALGIPDAGTRLAADVSTRLAAPATSAAGPHIAFLYLRGNAGVYLIGGKGSGADDLIARLGGVDVGTLLGVSGFAPLTGEQLATSNPDVILAMTRGVESVGGADKLFALPGISATKAARNHALITEQDERLLSFGPATPDVISCLAQQLRALS